MERLNTELSWFCPRRSCPHYQSENNVIIKYGTCFACGQRTNTTAKWLLGPVDLLGNGSRHRLLRITTDQLKAYQNAVEWYFVDSQF